jgi:peptidyl-dipeptidase A
MPFSPAPPCLIALAALVPGAATTPTEAFQAFLKTYETRVIPLSREANLASYEASVSGKEGDYARSADLQVQLKQLHSDRAAYTQLKAWRASGEIKSPLLARELDLLFLAYQGNQLPEALLTDLVKRQTDIEKVFNTFRARLGGRPVSDNEVDKVLSESTDSARLETAWKASKEVGRAVAPAIVELVKERNAAARVLGYRNFQAMQLALGEQDPDAVLVLFDELDRLTRTDFAAAKSEIDQSLSKRLGVPVKGLRPWHYQDRFFQAAPKVHAVDLDAFFQGKDLVKVAERYYAGLGLPIADILARSDLFEKPGKYQHAFSSDIDRAGDVRILCSMKSNAYWMDTILHESGHGVYSKFNDPKLPWLLRDAAHAFTTEAVANLFGRFASNPAWLQDVMGLSAAERSRISGAVAASQRLDQLVFSRWSQVMFRFEKALYENPDQDLNRLWWDLVERYQGLKRPEGRNEPDWAAKIHVALYPAYYHNYLMGQLLASQLHHHVGTVVLKAQDWQAQSYAGHPEVGQYFREQVFQPGMRYPWAEMIERATGEKLTPRYYAEQFVKGR